MDENVKQLHQAIENSDEQLIKTLIQNGVDLKARNDRGMNSLHIAVESSSSEIVNQLLEADKSLVNEKVVSSERESNDIVGYTALHFSAKLTDTKIVKLLFCSGAKGYVVDRNLRTPLHVAALYGNTEGVEELLRHHAPVNAEDCEGRTAFMYAVECDHMDIVKILLRHADKEICKSYAKAIIEIANDSRCVEFVQLLLDDKCRMLCDVGLIEILQCAIEKKRIYVRDNLLSCMNISFSLGKSLENPRTIATVHSVNETNIKVAQLLMNYYNYIIKFVDLEAALHFAVITNCNDILNTYLQEGVNVDCTNFIGNSLLYMTCLENNLDAAKKCIALGCDVNAKNGFGETALHAAGRSKNLDLIGFLKESGCDLNAKNNNFETPFEFFLNNHCSFHNENLNLSSDVIESKLTKVMLVAKALLKPEMDLTCHEYNECVLHRAVKTGIAELVKMVFKYHPFSDHLEKENKETCLHVAVGRNYVDVAKFFLESGANPNIRDSMGRLPITIAICEGHEEMVKLLVNCSKLNAYSNNKKTLMHLAAGTNNKGIISALVNAGADIHAKDICGKTAVCYVSAEKCESIYQHLLNVGFDVNFGYHETLEYCRCWSRFYTKEFTKIHVLKLKLIEYNLQPFLKSLIDNAEMEFKNIYDDIRKEAKRLMTSCIPDTIIPFMDIIKLDDKELANYAINESVVQVFEDVDSLKMVWPHYSEILIGRMTKGFVRRRLLDKGVGFDNMDTSTLHSFKHFSFFKNK